jgi:hypothetical protein
LGLLRWRFIVSKGEIIQKLRVEKEIEDDFYYYNYLEDKKVKLTVIEFIHYVIIWLDRLILVKEGIMRGLLILRIR